MTGLDARGHTRRSHDRAGSGRQERAGNSKPQVVVAVVGRVPVAVGRPHVLRFVVPAAATVHAGPKSPSGSSCGSNHPPRKTQWRKRHVLACNACPTQPFTRAITSSRVTVLRPIAIAQAAQAIAESPDILLRQPSPAVGQQHESEKLGRLLPRDQSRLFGCRLSRRPTRKRSIWLRQSSSCSRSCANRAKSST